MALELNYYELFIKKFNDFAFLINLKMNTDLGDNSYQDTFSKFFLIKTVIEKMLDKINENNTSSINNSFSGYVDNSHTEKRGSITSESILGDLKVLEMNHIDQFFNYDSDNKVVQHIKQLLINSYDKISQDLESMGDKHKTEIDKLPSKLYQNHEKIIQWDLFIGKLLYDKDKKIERLNKQVAELETYIKNINANQEQEKVMITDLGNREKEREREKEKEQMFKPDESKRVKELLKLIEDSNLK